MKINKKEFDSLTREPDIVQEIDGKNLSIFFMTPDEEGIYAINNRHAIWTSDGKEYRLLISKEYYDHGDIKEFYTEDVNRRWLEYVERMTKLQRKTLLTIMLPVMLVYIAVAILALVFFSDYALYILIGLMVVIFVVNYFQNKMIRGNMEKENDAAQLEIQQLLGDELYDKIAQDQLQYRQMKNPEPLDEDFVEETEAIEGEQAEEVAAEEEEIIEVEEGDDLDEEV